MVLPIIVYTHSSYNDIFEIAIKRYKKYANQYKIVIFSDKIINTEYEHIIYDENKVYSKRLFDCLNELSNKYTYEYILFAQDNNALFDFIDDIKLNKILMNMSQFNIDQLRLFKGGIFSKYEKICENIYEIPKINSYIYSVQPAIWKLSSIKKIMNDNYYDYRNIELNIDRYMLQYKNCFYFDNEETFINTDRCKSSIFPIIHLTWIGKWLYNENIPYINELISEYNININIRGFV
jgi:hypothetical protein